MSTTTRQTNLILNQDWKTIYQTFQNADFKSYDFENLRRVMITYLRENYPEDFNDYIESSEYLALIDAVAFLGQSLSFRIDLASRENFLELAERKESVLRLARMLSYNAKRNMPASGLLKFDTVSTTEDILDSNGKNLQSQTIIWNDPTNINWLEQFITVLNSAMSDNTEFGRSQGTDIIQTIPTEQYRFRTLSTDVPLFAYTKTVAGRGMAFELVSTSFIDSESIYEEPPIPGNQLAFVYRNDSRGAGSANTGFFMLFKQGSLELADFAIEVPTTNEKVAVDAENINNDDVWLYSLSAAGLQQNQWTKVSSLVGNNIAYNTTVNNVRNIYEVVTKSNDTVDLLFGDGVYGNLPQGNFRFYYRISNGLAYTINPTEMRGINVSIAYANKQGVQHTLTVSMSLKSTVTSAAPSEDIDSIRAKAPAIYYTQNRMVTGEDYNLAPLSASQDILKVKSINRTSSGISRNFDIIDTSGKYSSVNVFANDGYIYKNENEKTLSFKFTNRLDIINFIRNSIEPLFTNTEVYNFYFTKYNRIIFVDQTTAWFQLTTDVNNSTGYFVNTVDGSKLKAGTYTTNTLKYAKIGSLIKFIPPTSVNAGKKNVFKNNQLIEVDISAEDPEYKTYIWTKIIKVAGDGTNAGRGALTSGRGPVEFNDVIPSDAVASRIIPKFVNNLPTALENEIVNLMINSLNFGLRYDYVESAWKIITASNLNTISNFSLGKAGDTTNSSIDASWLIAFIKEGDYYNIQVRGLEYIFGSISQNRFYLDVNQKTYDAVTGKTLKDQIRVLNINTDYSRIDALKRDIIFEVSDTIRYEDGYEAADQIKISFSDSDFDGVIDDPDAFEEIVGTDQPEDTTAAEEKFLFFRETVDTAGNKIFEFIDNTNKIILAAQNEADVNIDNYNEGTLIYFYSSDEDRIKKVVLSSNNSKVFELQSDYKATVGRDKLKFHYIHNANVDRRIDPSVSNIIDIFLLTRSYDTAYRNYLAGAAIKPEPPSSDSLRISFGTNLNSIKSISDEIVYHPTNYKVLFGSLAAERLQATFKIVKNPSKTINDNDLKVRIITAINTFFDIGNWDFGDRFYVGELITYITNAVSPDVSNLVIVPKQNSQVFGSLFEIQSRSDEIFVSGATVDDIEIVSSINAVEIRANVNSIISSTN
jgi:hypothetical protein